MVEIEKKKKKHKVHLVTGCSGFVGEALTLRLLELNHIVLGIDLIESRIKHPNFNFIQGSILDRNLVQKSMQDVFCVHHVAAAVPLAGSSKLIYETNINGSEILATQAAKNGVEHFIFTSSSAIFSNVGKTGILSLPDAFEDYGKSKAIAEKKILNIFENSNTQVNLVRPRTILGPNRMGIFSILFYWIQNNKNVYVIGDGKNLMQLLHIEDYCFNHIASISQNGNQIVNLGSRDLISLENLLQGLIDFSGSKSKIVKIPTFFSTIALGFLYYIKISPLTSWHYKSYGRSIYFDDSNFLKWQSYQYSSLDVLKSAYTDYLRNPKVGDNTINSLHKKEIKKTLLNLLKIFP